jgi:hypothetical protein
MTTTAPTSTARLTEREIAPEDVERLVNALVAAGKALTAAQLAVFFYGVDTDGNRRRVRAIASAARPRIVSFPGSMGYDLFERCGEEELRHGIAAIRTQSSAMHRDADLYQSAFNRRFQPVGQTELFPRG